MKETIIGDSRLIMGDCRELLPSLGDIGVVVTDPPYGIDYQSGYATTALWQGGYKIRGDANTKVRDEMLRILWDNQNSPALVFGSRKAPEPEGCRMVLVWDKGPALGMGALDLPWKPSSEEIYVLGRGFRGSRDESNVIYCPPVQSMAKNGRQHPNEKPVNLITRLLKKCPEGIVVDPFMGSGTTGVACVALGRKFIGIESDPKYFDVACKRIDEAYKQGNLFNDRVGVIS
jgi:DNA modification methylase